MPKSKSFYSQTLKAPAKKIAGTNPVGNVPVGPSAKLTVPAKPAVMHGIGQQTQLFRKASVPGAQRYGFVGKRSERLSGHSGAHRIGSKRK